MSEDLNLTARISQLQGEMSATKEPGNNLNSNWHENISRTVPDISRTIPDLGTRFAARAELDSIVLKGTDRQKRLANKAITTGLLDREEADKYLYAPPDGGCLAALYFGIVAGAAAVYGVIYGAQELIKLISN